MTPVPKILLFLHLYPFAACFFFFLPPYGLYLFNLKFYYLFIDFLVCSVFFL